MQIDSFRRKKTNDWGTEAKVRSEGIAEKLRDRSLFIVWGWGRGGFWGDHLIFRTTKRGIRRN